MATNAATASSKGRSVGVHSAHIRHGGGTRERHSGALAAQEGAGREDAGAVAQVDLGDGAVMEDLHAARFALIQGDDAAATVGVARARQVDGQAPQREHRPRPLARPRGWRAREAGPAGTGGR